VAVYSYSQLRSLWIGAGGPSSQANIAAAVALAESSGRSDAVHVNDNGTVDRGLWQINSVHGYGVSSFDPVQNARQAVSIWHGSGWGAWTTFTSGAYLRYLSGASASGGATGGGGGSATYRYSLGPCDGRTATFSPPLADGQVVSCGGAGYQFNRGNPGVLIWLDTGPPPAPDKVPPLETRQVGRAWHKLMTAMGHNMPMALNRSAAGRRRIRRAVR
jgi:hypothetical protein